MGNITKIPIVTQKQLDEMGIVVTMVGKGQSQTLTYVLQNQDQLHLLSRCETYLVGLGFVKDDKPNLTLFYYAIPQDKSDLVFCIHKDVPISINIEIIPTEEGRRVYPLIRHMRIDSFDDLKWICEHQEEMCTIIARLVVA